VLGSRRKGNHWEKNKKRQSCFTLVREPRLPSHYIVVYNLISWYQFRLVNTRPVYVDCWTKPTSCNVGLLIHTTLHGSWDNHFSIHFWCSHQSRVQTQKNISFMRSYKQLANWHLTKVHNTVNHFFTNLSKDNSPLLVISSALHWGYSVSLYTLTRARDLKTTFLPNCYINFIQPCYLEYQWYHQNNNATL
jgi:hypothetical protein